MFETNLFHNKSSGRYFDGEDLRSEIYDLRLAICEGRRLPSSVFGLPSPTLRQRSDSRLLFSEPDSRYFTYPATDAVYGSFVSYAMIETFFPCRE